MDLWEFFCYGPRGRMNTWLFLYKKIDGHCTSVVLRELEICDFDKTCHFVNEMMAVTVKKISHFFMVKFFYKEAKR